MCVRCSGNGDWWWLGGILQTLTVRRRFRIVIASRIMYGKHNWMNLLSILMSPYTSSIASGRELDSA
jgi:hypothetical protein